jgi:hypothetical protein
MGPSERRYKFGLTEFKKGSSSTIAKGHFLWLQQVSPLGAVSFRFLKSIALPSYLWLSKTSFA